MQLSREDILRMVGGGASSTPQSVGGDVDMAGYATEVWVNENYLSIDFFRSLFKAYTSNNTEVVPNGGDTSVIASIKALHGLWTEEYLSALGLNGAVSGEGGGASRLQDLTDVQLGTLSNGQALLWNSQQEKWVNGAVPQGTVTSVGLSVPTGFEASAAVTDSGVITLRYASGYALPTTAKQGQWDTAYGWGNHATAGYVTALDVSGDAVTWTKLGTVNQLTVPYATRAGYTQSLRTTQMASGDDYDSLSGYTLEKGGFVASYNNGSVNGTASSNINVTLNGTANGYPTLVSFGHERRTIQLLGHGWDDTLKYRHVAGSGTTSDPYGFSAWKTIAFTDYSYSKAESDARYLKIDFFRSLFKAYKSDGTEVVPNGGDTSVIASIKALHGLWTEEYLSALGLNGASSSGGGLDVQGVIDILTGTEYQYTLNVAHLPVHDHDSRYYISGGTIHLGGNSITPLTSYTETDPTVPAWAKASTKPSYTLDEVSDGSTRKLSDYVTLGTSQTITANKTFTGQVMMMGSYMQNLIIDSAYATNGNTCIQFKHTTEGVSTEYGGICMSEVNGSLKRYTSAFNYYTVWDSGNDGTGSGLDADLLDGQHASAFASASAVTTLQGYFTNGVANVAARLSAVSKTAWGQTYWTSGGVPQDVSGSMTGVGSLTMTGQLTMWAGATDSHDFKIGWVDDGTGNDVLTMWAYEGSYYDMCLGTYADSVVYGGLYFDASAVSWGIGTANPYCKMDVNGGVKAGKFYLYKPNAGNDTGAVYLTYDAGNGGVHVVGGGLYADTFLSALGVNAAVSGGGVDAQAVIDILTGTEYQYTLNVAHLPVHDHDSRYYISGGTIHLGGNSITPLTSYTETDPTVPAWAKASTKPSYTLDEVSDGSTRKLSDYVTLGTTQTITGTKTITGQLLMTGAYMQNLVIDSAYATNGNTCIQFKHTTSGTSSAYGGICMSEVNGSLKRYTSALNYYTVWDSGNDGTGSGLDADLLDGQHASAFASASAVTTLQGYFTNGVANVAARLSAVSKTAWGQTYWTSGGVPQDVSGNMTGVGSLTMTGQLTMWAGATDSHDFKIGWVDDGTGNDVLTMWAYEGSYYDMCLGTYADSVVYGGLYFDASAWSWGIGTANPYCKMDVNGGVKAGKFYLYKPNAGNDTGAVYLTYDAGNGGVHVVGGGLYADTFLSALGVNAAVSGGGVDAQAVIDILTGTEYQYTLNVAHLPVHTHTKAQITDFAHTHTKADITDFAHNHDERYVTALSVNGDSVTWTKNGTVNTLTVPYATRGLRIAQSTLGTDGNLSTFTHSTDLIYAAVGGSNTVADKPDGVDSFGVIAFKTANGYYGQLLVEAGGRAYVRSSNALNGGWNKMAYVTDNVASATKLLTARTVTLTGDVTGSFSFDGSQAVSFATTIGSGKVTNAMLAGSIANNKLANSQVTVNGSSVSLGGSVTTASWGTARTVTISDYDGTNNQATSGVDGSANITLKLPQTIKGSLTGNAATASRLIGNSDCTAWGRTFWTSGVPQSTSGAIQDTGNITPSASNTFNVGSRSNWYNSMFAGYLNIVDGASGVGNDFNVRFWDVNSKRVVVMYAWEEISGTGTAADILIGSTSPSYGLYYDSATFRWGVKTGTPAYELDVNGTAKATTLRATDIWIGGVHVTADNDGLHVNGAGLYADTFLSALGLNAAQSGGGVDAQAVIDILTGTEYQYTLNVAHLPVHDHDSRYYISGGTIHLGGNSITPLTSYTETDPTVPAWAKASTKPSYTLDEVSDGSTRKLSDYVTLGTTQTITGTKKITGQLMMTGAYMQNLVIDSAYATNGNTCIQFKHTTSGTSSAYGGICMSEVNGSLKRYTSAWNYYTVWDSGNDGTGSGLDADLLDGKHSTDFVTRAGFFRNSNTAATVTPSEIILPLTNTAYDIWALDLSRLAQTSLSNNTSLATFTHSTDLIYTAKGGNNGCTDKPSDVDAFGLISLKTAAGYYGQIMLGANDRFYVRASNSLEGKTWNKVAYTTDTVAAANKLSGTGTYTVWGRTYWQNGVPQSISDTYMTGVTNIDSLLYFDTTSSYVGIGTASPAYKLDVNGTGRFVSGVVSNNTIQSDGDLYMTNQNAQILMDYDSVLELNGTSSALMVGYGTTAYSNFTTEIYGGRLDFCTGLTSRMYIDEYGCVGINTYYPQGYTLNVNGTTLLDGLVTANKNIEVLNNGSTASAYVKIGGRKITYDSANGALFVDGSLYATGGISALGYMQITDAGLAGSLIPTTSNAYDIGSASKSLRKIYSNAVTVWEHLGVGGDAGNNYAMYVNVEDDGGDLLPCWFDCPVTVSSGLKMSTGTVGTAGSSSDTNGTIILTVNGGVKAKKFWLDGSRYLYLDGTTLKYYNGSASKTVVLS